MAKVEDLEKRCKKALKGMKSTVSDIRDILKDIEMELTHLIEYRKYKLFSMPMYKGKYKAEYDFYNGNGYDK
jgi:hypothetical protein